MDTLPCNDAQNHTGRAGQLNGKGELSLKRGEDRDFIDFDDGTVLNAALKAYGDNEILREKIAIRQKTFPIFLMLFYIGRKDGKGMKESAEKIRRMINAVADEVTKKK